MGNGMIYPVTLPVQRHSDGDGTMYALAPQTEHKAVYLTAYILCNAVSLPRRGSRVRFPSRAFFIFVNNVLVSNVPVSNVSSAG